MLFKVPANSPFTLKIAYHIKVPYADRHFTIFDYDSKPYNSIYNLMQYVEKNYFATYFYAKNNLTSYFRKRRNENSFVIYDVLKNDYEIIGLKKLDYNIESTQNDKPKTLVVKMANDVVYLISDNVTDEEGEKFVMILNLNNKQILYKKLRNENMYISWFYPIANVIVPILRVTSEGLFLDLVDLSSGRLDTISYGLASMSEIMSKIISREKKSLFKLSCSVESIDSFHVMSENYKYHSHKNDGYYIKHLILKLKFSVSERFYQYDVHDVFLNIKVANKKLSLYLTFDNSTVMIHKDTKTMDFLKDVSKNFLLGERQFDGRIINVKLHNQIYVDECYSMHQDEYGFRILGQNTNLGGDGIKSSIYSYENYKILVFHVSDGYKRPYMLSGEDWTAEGIVIIDIKHQKALITTYKSKNEGYCTQNLPIASYYCSSKSQKIIFMSQNSHCFSVMDIKEINETFDKLTKINVPECQENINSNTDKIVKSFYVIPRIIRAAAQQHYVPEASLSYSTIKVIGSYVDEKSDRLYIAATYNINNAEYIGLFMWPIYDDKVDLKLLYYKPVKLLYSKRYKTSIPDVLKIELNDYNDKWLNLHIKYDINKHTFVDVENNRSSSKFAKVYEYFEIPKDRIEMFDHFLFIEYKRRNSFDLLGKLCFVLLNKFMLVKRLPAAYM